MKKNIFKIMQSIEVWFNCKQNIDQIFLIKTKQDIDKIFLIKSYILMAQSLNRRQRTFRVF